MKATEFIKFLISANSGYSSKRFAALVLLMFGITIPVMCIFLTPMGEIHDSVLLLALQLLASGCGLLGFTLKEKPVIGKPSVILPEDDKEDAEVKEKDEEPIEDESSKCLCNHNPKRRRRSEYDDSNLG